jgi:hypothetical protein
MIELGSAPERGALTVAVAVPQLAQQRQLMPLLN